ncbi:hypothetical protein F2Q65_08745 [Thiohalocapsa marina]|uniref:Uncharacterized protein n=1 Tax=Thiohalocapsa marina TaxID=424902 RepID=A0A5M8FKC6_9GAMM|nr:hypothetical protein F2Q65_08745 [Thiohalocapsa marina]
MLVIQPADRPSPRSFTNSPPPKWHHHRHCGVLAPDSPLRTAAASLLGRALADAPMTLPSSGFSGGLNFLYTKLK